jgi:uncharacterized membrane protein YphA (DoxX/SURF4 family)
MADAVKHWDAFALAARGVTAAVWLYNGLWLKILAPDPHHAQIVAATLGNPVWLTVIGTGETALALAILSGQASRVISLLQIAVLIAMNATGILLSGAIDKPMGLIISNLPLAACAAAIAIFGPGRWIFPPSKV